MNTDFHRIISATTEDRRDLFLTTSNRLGIPLQNIEKDFWICWVLNLLFNEQNQNEPRLLFKGGTSLSKAYALISRFSEDLDITVFREDLGENIEVNDLEKLSGKQQRNYLKRIKNACQAYIQGTLKERLNRQIKLDLESPVTIDPDDPHQQTLLIQYPSVIKDINDYVKPTIKIEAGAKSALDPHQIATIYPYVATEIPEFNLLVPNIITINPERTFWNKIVILHGLRRWYEHRGELRQQGHRISRHYYDIYKLINSPVGQKSKTDYSLAIDCARHAMLFFNSSDLDLQYARPGFFEITPTTKMQEILQRDYQAMSGMIFGEIPKFLDVIETIKTFENTINQSIL